MKCRFRRTAIIGSLGIALSGLAAGSAQAAIPTTTLPAGSITSTAAILNGKVATGGAAVLWQFRYGTTTGYGRTTTSALIPTGNGTISVSANITGLKPRTTYHFQLATQLGDSSTSYPLVITFGQDQTLTTTKAGTVRLTGGPLSINKSVVSVPLGCASSQTCKGKLTLTARIKIGTRFENLTFASKSFSIRSGHKLTVKPRLSRTAINLLKNARGHRLVVKLTAKFSTGQPRLSKHVTLILR